MNKKNIFPCYLSISKPHHTYEAEWESENVTDSDNLNKNPTFLSSWWAIFCACCDLSDQIFVQNTFNGTPVQIPHLCNILSKYSTKDVRGPHIFAKSLGSWGKGTSLYLFGCFDKIFESIKFAFILNICQRHQKNSVMSNMKIIHFGGGLTIVKNYDFV